MTPNYGKLLFAYERALAAVYGLETTHPRHKMLPTDSVGSVGAVISFCPCGEFHLIGAESVTAGRECLRLSPSPNLYCIEQYGPAYTTPNAEFFDPGYDEPGSHSVLGLGEDSITRKRINHLGIDIPGHISYLRGMPWSARAIRHMMCQFSEERWALSGEVFRPAVLEDGGDVALILKRDRANKIPWGSIDWRSSPIRASSGHVLVVNERWGRHLAYR